MCRLLSTPTPRGLVKVSGRPAGPASLRNSLSASATPVTDMPYFGSGVVDAVPAGDVAAGQPGDVEAAAEHLTGEVEGTTSRGHASRLTATTGSPPMA